MEIGSLFETPSALSKYTPLNGLRNSRANSLEVKLNIADAVLKTRATLYPAKPLSIRALRKVRASLREYSWRLLLPATSLRHLQAVSAAALKVFSFPAFFVSDRF